MATRLRKSHFLMALISTWIEDFKRALASGVPTAAEVNALTGTGYTTAGQVVTTSDNQTVTANQYAGCWLIGATKAPCLIVSHPAATAGTVAFTVYGAAPATTAEGYRILRAPTPVTAVGTTVSHYDRAEYSVTAANASNLATSRALLKAILVATVDHREDLLAHAALDTDNLSPRADLADNLRSISGAALTGSGGLCERANNLKGAINGHLTEAGVHVVNDTSNPIASTDATDQGSLNTLLNEIKTDFNLHLANGLPVPSWRVLED